MVSEARDQNDLLGVLLRLRETQPAYDPSQLAQEDLDMVAALAYTLPTSPSEVDVEVRRIDNRVVNLESFFNQIIELQRRIGIQDFRYFP
jgi:hypothetical protein